MCLKILILSLINHFFVEENDDNVRVMVSYFLFALLFLGGLNCLFVFVIRRERKNGLPEQQQRVP